LTIFLYKNILSKIKWFTDDHIDLTEYYARPIMFLKADGYKMDEIKKLDIFPEATVYARNNGCSIRGFDKHLDSPLIKNGDMFIYAGSESKAMATTLEHMYNIETMTFRELKEMNS